MITIICKIVLQLSQSETINIDQIAEFDKNNNKYILKYEFNNLKIFKYINELIIMSYNEDGFNVILNHFIQRDNNLSNIKTLRSLVSNMIKLQIFNIIFLLKLEFRQLCGIFIDN